MRKMMMAAGALALAACGTNVQTSSGADYLARAPLSVSAVGAEADGSADAIRAAASVEPLLRFPAKIGIARIEGGVLTPIPDAEMAAFAAVLEETGGAYGEFVPLNLLVTAMAVPEEQLGALSADPSRRRMGNHHTGYKDQIATGGLSRARAAVEAIRIGAARQHMDGVFVYEVFGTADSKQSPLSIGNLTILGAFMLPGSKVEAVGHAEGILVDVRNGYPYLTASETVTRDGLAASARAWNRALDKKEQAQAQAVQDMADTLPAAFAKLAVELGNLPTPATEVAAAE